MKMKKYGGEDEGHGANEDGGEGHDSEEHKPPSK